MSDSDNISITYPKAKKVDKIEDFHGTEINDVYRWMETHNDPEVIDFVTKNNEIVDNYINETVLEKYKDKFSNLLDYTRYGPPAVRNDRYFYTKNTGLQPQAIYYYRDGVDGEEQLLFDPNTLSEDGTTAINGAVFSEDGSMVAFMVSVHGSDWMELHLFDVESKEFLEDKIENIRNGTAVGWLKDNSGFYYSALVGKDEDAGGRKLWFHVMGTPQKEDKMLFEHLEDDEISISPILFEEEGYLFMAGWKDTMPRNMLYFMDLGTKEIKTINDEHVFSYQPITVVGHKVIINTNENAPNSKIVEIDLTDPEYKLKTIVEEKEYPLKFSTASNGKLILTYEKDVKHEVEIREFDGTFIKTIDFPTYGTIFPFGRKKQEKLFMFFTSFFVPQSIMWYDFENDELNQFHDPVVGVDVTQYHAKQVFYESKDGTKLPMYIMWKGELDMNGQTPTMLYGYGGFGVSLTPAYSSRGLAMMDAGGIYAIANLRGGGEYGEEWHQAGVLEKKQNVFDDFIAAAEYLIAENYTSTPKLCIVGGSNGGLLTAACALQRPDLFGAVLTLVGVLDMLRYHLYTIGKYWVPEYGDPDNPDHFEFMIKYSPLHNVKEDVEYPPMYISTADTDDRVDPAHSKKYAAILQDKAVGGPFLLRTVLKAGHGMGKPITKLIEDISYEFAFVEETLGM